MPYSDTTIDELVENLLLPPACKLDLVKLRQALDTLDTDAIRSLFIELHQLLNAGGIDPFTCDEIVCMIVDRVVKRHDVDAFQLLSFLLNLLNEIPISAYTGIVTRELSRTGGQKAISLFRKMLASDRQYLQSDVAWGIVVTQYTEPVQALSDESEVVRYETVNLLKEDETIQALHDRSERVRHAATKKLEKEKNDIGLIEALRDKSASVRRIAAWYVGRRQVMDAVRTLIELAQHEHDVETLRGAIWSLGVLRDKEAHSYIQNLSSHPDPLIVFTVQDALSKFNSELGEELTK